MEDFFSISFVELPHYIYQQDDFQSAVSDLRASFSSSSPPSYYCSPEFHKGVPIDGLARYCTNVWSTIMSNKDLDLPTQRELLAKVRCAVLSNKAKEDLKAAR